MTLEHVSLQQTQAQRRFKLSRELLIGGACLFLLLISWGRAWDLGPALPASYDLQLHPLTMGDKLVGSLAQTLGFTGTRLLLLGSTLATVLVLYVIGKQAKIEDEYLVVVMAAYALSSWRVTQLMILDTTAVAVPLVLLCAWSLCGEGKSRWLGAIGLFGLLLLHPLAGLAGVAAVLGLVWLAKKSVVRWGVGLLLGVIILASISVLPTLQMPSVTAIPFVDAGTAVGFSVFGLLLGLIGLGLRSWRLAVLSIVGLGMGCVLPSLWFLVDVLLAFGLAQFVLALKNRDWRYPDLGMVTMTLFVCSVLFSSLVAVHQFQQSFPTQKDAILIQSALPYLSPQGSVYVLPASARSYMQLLTDASVAVPTLADDIAVMTSRDSVQTGELFSKNAVSTIVYFKDIPSTEDVSDLLTVLQNPAMFSVAKDGTSMNVWLYTDS